MFKLDEYSLAMSIISENMKKNFRLKVVLFICDSLHFLNELFYVFLGLMYFHQLFKMKFKLTNFTI